MRLTTGAAVLAALALALTLPLAVFARGSGRSAPAPSFAFGRTGGNIIPYTVRIGADGRLAATGPVHLANPAASISLSARNGLIKLARAERFSKLPAIIRCPGVLPDIASLYVTVAARGTTRTVTAHGTCNASFDELYAVLSAVAGAS